jgi:dihydroorotate dehydrogenase
MNLYQSILQPLLFSGFKADPEALHHRLIHTCAWLTQPDHDPFAQWIKHQLQQRFCLETPTLQQQLWGWDFPNPVGLAAGFDKDGVATGIWASFGFGFVEVGTVTAHPQPGNPRPRLFRLPQDRAALNRMGFNNQGAAALATTLKTATLRATPAAGSKIPLGINLGKSKITPLELAGQDYLESFRLLQDLGDYFVVNVSSPNTPGLRSLQTEAQLAPILAALQAANVNHKPLLVKIAPDLDWDEITTVVGLAQDHALAGIIATNTTIARTGLQTQRIQRTGQAVTAEAGGISGAPLQQRSTEIIRFIHHQTQGQLPIIGVGGIFTAADAWEKITAGASLIQVYTGWIYEGPGMVRQILAGLQQRLEAAGMTDLKAAIGSASLK